jgi:hypothetical protein
MPFQPFVRRLLWLSLCGCAGCALPAGGKNSANPLQADSTASSSTPPASTASPASTAQPVASPGAAASTKPPSAAGAAAKVPGASAVPDPRVLDDVLAELAALGPIQPEAQQRLIDDLRKTDPAYWPMLVQTFRASLAYRRRAAERQSAKTPPTSTPESADAPTEIVQVAATEPIQEGALAAAAAAAPIEKTAGTPPPAAAPVDRPSGQPANMGGVTATAATPSPGNPAAPTEWRRHVEAAIGELERRNRDRPNDPEALANEVYLRLLDLAAGRRDDALRPIPGIPPAQQDYWAKQLFALSAYLDPRNSDSGRRAAEAGIHLAHAVASLGEQAPLVVRNLAFCTDVHSYGVLKRFESAEFKAGQQVLLYAEVENFKSDETAQGFHTSLEASYQILDAQGRRVAHDDLALTEEDCQNRRRDFFVRYFVTLPKTIYEGSYTLELTIEDKLARKIGQSKIGFNVKEKK